MNFCILRKHKYSKRVHGVIHYYFDYLLFGICIYREDVEG